jgi:hypothetical protein
MSLDAWISWNCFSHRKILEESALAFIHVSDDGCALQRVTLRAASQKVTRAAQNERRKKRTQLIKLKVVTESGNRTEISTNFHVCGCEAVSLVDLERELTRN